MLILLILIYGVYIGTRRGLVMQAVYTAGYTISLGLAIWLSSFLGTKLYLLVPYPSASPESYFAFFKPQISTNFLEALFYQMVALLFILLLGWAVTRLIGAYWHDLTFYPLEKQIQKWGGGVVAFGCNYIFLTLILSILALVPVAGLQNILSHSWVATFMIKTSIGLISS
ncbi:CvpA family protein [Lactobacillus sp. DCY120]|uniref:CvpA family protein n=1 Tax=Bombilactobacillus apium TaxID=2675299 RepID=A0A850REH9_9LACO|nr:CvpA family protein [Bombilactobacillus apium]NVY97118.1 CvpA family protein [Bombilactobacillus apium]